MEIIFVLGAIFVAYVVHSKVTGNSNEESVAVASEKPEVSIVESANKKEEKVVAEKKKPVAKKTKPVVTKTAAVKAKAKPKAKPKASENTTFPAGSLRDPETGEMVKLANSYQMMRRWMKEALVTEGLLEKIYKTSEMDDAVEAKIIVAITKLQKLDKYQ
jgi:hypothetical protein